MTPTGPASFDPPPEVPALLARCTFPPAGTLVSCAVSGGPDSTALLILAVAAGLEVTALHVHHGLRPDAERDAEVVAATAERLGVAHEVRRVAVAPGPNLEARARDARRDALPPDVLTGHTLDDQAETVLMFLLRGTGPEGLAGMAPDRRPLLGLRRTETRSLCAAARFEVVDDPMNADPRFVRNRIRAELLPLADAIAGRDVAPLLARTAGLQRDLLDAVEAAATHVDPTDARAVAAAPRAVATAALRRWWRAETGEAYAPDAAAVERMLAVAAGSVTGAEVTGGWRVDRTAQRLRLVDTGAAGDPPLGRTPPAG